mgnify:FL=1
MKWIKESEEWKVPIMSWCEDVEDGAMEQAANAARLPFVFKHVALMPDCHQGYALPIGGVLATKEVILPYCVGVNIGCGMGAIQTNVSLEKVTQDQVNQIVELLHQRIPVGEGNHHTEVQGN